MTYRPGWWRRLTGFWRQNEINRGLDDEIAFHIEQQTAKNVRAGMSTADARRAALLKFGGVEPLKERTRDEFRPAVFQDFWRDMRIGARMLRRSPGFAAAAILTIGLGMLLERRVELEADLLQLLNHRVVDGDVLVARRRDVIAQRDLGLFGRRRGGRVEKTCLHDRTRPGHVAFLAALFVIPGSPGISPAGGCFTSQTSPSSASTRMHR